MNRKPPARSREVLEDFESDLRPKSRTEPERQVSTRLPGRLGDAWVAYLDRKKCVNGAAVCRWAIAYVISHDIDPPDFLRTAKP